MLNFRSAYHNYFASDMNIELRQMHVESKSGKCADTSVARIVCVP